MLIQTTCSIIRFESLSYHTFALRHHVPKIDDNLFTQICFTILEEFVSSTLNLSVRHRLTETRQSELCYGIENYITT